MPAKSESQHKLACMALAVKKNELSKDYSKSATEMANSMTEEQLREY